jgi:hypothetical protein
VSLTSCERLTPDHRLHQFDCGTPSLNRWLCDSALNSDSQGITRTFVCADSAQHVDRYFALTMGAVVKDSIPNALGRGGPESVIGGRLIVVDALSASLVPFYEHHGFVRFPSTLRLGMKGSSAARAVGMPWP